MAGLTLVIGNRNYSSWSMRAWVLLAQLGIAFDEVGRQAIIKDACTKAGIDLELKSIVASVFFGSDFANPDTYQKFWADMQMFTTTMTQPDPQTFMEQFTTWELSQKANKWASRNVSRWRNDEYDATHKAAQGELDPIKRAALFIKMNDLVCSDNYIIPVVYRPRVSAAVNKLSAPLSGWDTSRSSRFTPSFFA